MSPRGGPSEYGASCVHKRDKANQRLDTAWSHFSLSLTANPASITGFEGPLCLRNLTLSEKAPSSAYMDEPDRGLGRWRSVGPAYSPETKSQAAQIDEAGLLWAPINIPTSKIVRMRIDNSPTKDYPNPRITELKSMHAKRKLSNGSSEILLEQAPSTVRPRLMHDNQPEILSSNNVPTTSPLVMESSSNALMEQKYPPDKRIDRVKRPVAGKV